MVKAPAYSSETSFTIITSTFNCVDTLPYTAKSVAEQSWPAKQWIVADGASIDGTVDYIRTALNNVSVLITEPDRGVYDAWNKALPHVSGDWVIFLGAGDKFSTPDTLRDCSAILSQVPSYVNIAYGRVEFIDRPTDITGQFADDYWAGLSAKWGYGRPKMPRHQSVFHRAHMFKHGTRFDPSYKIAGDQAVVLPELLRNGGYDIKLTVTLMLRGGISHNPLNKGAMLREILRANRESGLSRTRIHYQLAALVYHTVKEVAFRIRRKMINSTKAPI